MDFLNNLMNYSHSRSFIELVLMLIGFSWIMKSIVYNFFYILFFCYSYSLLHVIAFTGDIIAGKLAIKSYLSFANHALFKWPFECFLNYCFEYEPDTIRISNYELKPPFFIRKAR